MRKRLFGMLAVAFACTAFAQTPVDTTKVIDLEEIVVVSSPKENQKLRQSPTAVSLLSAQDMQQHRVLSLKGASTLSPNFFMPDYGSRLTSAVYIRGIGSRINTPAVGMYVDNIPYLDKSAFDFNFYDIERIDILRGPQGTLYGRNTMAGLVKIHTRSPFNYQGTDLKLGYATKDNHRNVSLTHYRQLGDRFAFAVGGYYEGSDGFFMNTLLNKKMDYMESAGGRVRAIWKASPTWTIDFNLNYDYSDEGGYPYDLVMAQSASDIKMGRNSNRPASYRRNLLNGGLIIEHQAPLFVMTATTGFQHLNDRMFLDQDFTNLDIYTLEQKQNLNALTEEVTFRSKGERKWDWVVGVSGFVQGLRTTGPVTFRSDGVVWMQQLINGYMPNLSDKGMTMGVTLTDNEFVTGGAFKTPVTNAALFHQSTFHLTDRLSASLGLRVDYEHTHMDYDAAGTINYDFTMTSPRMPIELKDLMATAQFNGSIDRDYTQLLPKIALQYDFDKQNNIYATVSKGYRSGGYNVQMFSDLLQVALRNSMMVGVKQGTSNYLDLLAQRGMPQQMITMIKGYLDLMPIAEEQDVKESVAFRPEYTWNYEVGAHLGTRNHRLQADVAAFLMDTRDQQIAHFSKYGFGRMMVNAGHSQSYGLELATRAVVNRHLDFYANYGYTHATFRDYEMEEGTNLRGNRVPYVPMHTLNVGANYTLYLNRSYFNQVTLGVNYTGAGNIYWTEDNGLSEAANGAAQSSSSIQPCFLEYYYGLWNANVTLSSKVIQINFWGRNLGNKNYHTFAFDSMNRRFTQVGKPIQFGVDVRLHF